MSRLALWFAPAAMLLVAATACASDEVDRASAEATTGATETVKTPTQAEQRWAEGELVWVGEMEALIAEVGLAVAAGRKPLDPRTREFARRSIASLGDCFLPKDRKERSEYRRSPTIRTALVNDTLAKACARMNRASLAASGALLVEDPHLDIRAETRKWREESQRALELLRAGRRELEALSAV